MIGETGIGKSTLINNLLGKEVAPAALARFLDIHKGNIHVEGMPAPAPSLPRLVDVTLAGEDKMRFEGIIKEGLSKGTQGDTVTNGSNHWILHSY